MSVTHRLRTASIQVMPESSVVIPVRIEGLPDEIDVLGERWVRKLEFHLTLLPAELIERAMADSQAAWKRVTEVLQGRLAEPVAVRDEVRRVTHPERPEARTLIAMAELPGIEQLYRELSEAVGSELQPPPTHITLYSRDPAEGIGISDHTQLAERAPELSPSDQQVVRDAMSFDQVFFDDDGIALDPDDDALVSLGRTDPVFTPGAIRAVAYAAHVHAEQRRKGGAVPYLAHLLGVAVLVAEDGGSESEIIGALLHDAAEDHGGEQRLTDIRRRFGDEVQEIVRAMSDSLAPEGERKQEWRARKERYLEHLRREQDDAILRVANADKLHNARSILTDYRQLGEALWSRFQAPRDQQRWYYAELVRIFNDRRAGSPLARELDATVSELERELSAD